MNPGLEQNLREHQIFSSAGMLEEKDKLEFCKKFLQQRGYSFSDKKEATRRPTRLESSRVLNPLQMGMPDFGIYIHEVQKDLVHGLIRELHKSDLVKFERITKMGGEVLTASIRVYAP